MAGGLSPIGFGAPAPQGFGGGADTAIGTILYAKTSPGKAYVLADGTGLRVANPAAFPFKLDLSGLSINPAATPRDNSGTAYGIVSIATSGTSWVAIDSRGNIYRAPADRSAWTLVRASTGNTFGGVAYGNGRYVAVGQGLCARSLDDGLNWATASSVPLFGGTPANQGNCIASNGTLFVAGFSLNSSSGSFFWSTDGFNWTQISNTNNQYNYRYGQQVTWGGGWFQIIGYLDSHQYYLMSVSSDGKTFAFQGGQLTYYQPNYILGYANGYWFQYSVTQNRYFYSIDGQNFYQLDGWLSASGSGSYGPVVYAEGYYWFVRSNRLYIAKDLSGITRSAVIGTYGTTFLRYDNGKFVLDGGVLYEGVSVRDLFNLPNVPSVVGKDDAAYSAYMKVA